MYNTNKSLSIMSFVIGLVVFILAVFTSPVLADEDYGNVLPDANMMMNMENQESMNLPFDSNNYSFLVYDSEAQSQRSIVAAMKIILGRDLTQGEIRGPSNPVTPTDLATHDILIVGWNADGNTAGLHSDDLAQGITGRVILTGHDLDYHTIRGSTEQIKQAAQTMLIQAIDYVLAGGGTGMITLGCSAHFPYLPQAWDVNAVTEPPLAQIHPFKSTQASKIQTIPTAHSDTSPQFPQEEAGSTVSPLLMKLYKWNN